MEHSKNLPACKRSYHQSSSLTNEQDTLHFGRALAPLLRRGDCLLFYGDLGMGKTTLIRGILSGLAQQDGLAHLDVPSPTFTLVQNYHFSALNCYHYDLYRLPEEDNHAALLEIGFDDSLDDGVVLAEWPERLGDDIPHDALCITLQQSPDQTDGRHITLHGSAIWTDRLSTLKGSIS
jgi:tRNA threonylcarbamoyl adenosine modification protein YjeE